MLFFGGKVAVNQKHPAQPLTECPERAQDISFSVFSV
jgi:hypothetical protein